MLGTPWLENTFWRNWIDHWVRHAKSAQFFILLYLGLCWFSGPGWLVYFKELAFSVESFNHIYCKVNDLAMSSSSFAILSASARQSNIQAVRKQFDHTRRMCFVFELQHCTTAVLKTWPKPSTSGALCARQYYVKTPLPPFPLPSICWHNQILTRSCKEI